MTGPSRDEVGGCCLRWLGPGDLWDPLSVRAVHADQRAAIEVSSMVNREPFRFATDSHRMNEAEYYQQLADEYKAHAHDPALTASSRAAWEELARSCLVCAEAARVFELAQDLHSAKKKILTRAVH